MSMTKPHDTPTQFAKLFCVRVKVSGKDATWMSAFTKHSEMYSLLFDDYLSDVSDPSAFCQHTLTFNHADMQVGPIDIPIIKDVLDRLRPAFATHWLLDASDKMPFASLFVTALCNLERRSKRTESIPPRRSRHRAC